MSLRLKGEIWHYRFSYKGLRYEGTTGEKRESRARIVESDKMREVLESRRNPLFRKAPTLEAYSVRFLDWVDTAPKLKPKYRLYLRNGWRMLKDQRIAKLRLDEIEPESTDKLDISGSNSNINNAIRTLRRMLGRAVEEKILRSVPSFELYEEQGRDEIVEPWVEDLLLELAPPDLRTAILLGIESGMRPDEIARLEWGRINYSDGAIQVERGKSARARRKVPMTPRLRMALEARQQGSKGEWVFPSTGGKSGKKSVTGHTLSTSFDKQWAALMAKVRAQAGKRRFPNPPAGLVFYSTRHTFATRSAIAGVDVATLSRMMGHADIRTTMRYFHLIDAMDAATTLHRHNETKRGLRLVKEA